MNGLNGIKKLTVANTMGWIKPTWGHVKINVDEAVSFQSRTSVVGIIAKNSSGIVDCSLNVNIGFASPLISEMKTIWHRMVLAQERDGVT